MSDWKELPDWKNPLDYKFAETLSPQGWAWEFLRRNPEYRDSWAQFTDFKGQYGASWRKRREAYVYDPPIGVDEEEQQWMKRIALTGDDPKKTLLNEHLGHSWGLKSMYDPMLPYAPEFEFLPHPQQEYPRLIFSIEEFSDYIETEEHEWNVIQKLRQGIAILAFDTTLPLTDQIKSANAMLKKLVSQKASGHSNKSVKWQRHLRCLDARRSNPKGTYASIGKEFGDDDRDTLPEKQGQEYVSQADKMASSGYRHILLMPKAPQ